MNTAKVKFFDSGNLRHLLSYGEINDFPNPIDRAKIKAVDDVILSIASKKRKPADCESSSSIGNIAKMPRIGTVSAADLTPFHCEMDAEKRDDRGEGGDGKVSSVTIHGQHVVLNSSKKSDANMSRIEFHYLGMVHKRDGFVQCLGFTL